MNLDLGFQVDRTTGKDEWLTPPRIFRALGEFDLDPCAPHASRRPWDCAKRSFSVEDNGLAQPWEGRVWMNPPYGSDTGKWMARLAAHGNGIALIFARTETATFFESVWGKADAMMFLRGRLAFFDVRGMPSKNSAGAPSVLIAYGKNNADALKSSGLDGFYLCAK